MKISIPPVLRVGNMGIRQKTALLSWMVTLITLGVFIAVILPSQKQTFVENLQSKARGVSISLQDVAAGAVVTEDYSEVVDHCMELLSGDDTIEFLVLTRNDGFSLVHTRTGWSNEQFDGQWRPSSRMISSKMERSDFFNKEAFRYSHPFEYSGIEWGWIHVGLSLDSYNANLKKLYFNTAWITIICTLVGLVASIIYSKRIVTPILRLRETVQEITNGNLSARADVTSNDEVETLATAFNSMTQAVQDREARVRSQNKQLASLVTDKVLHEGDINKASMRFTKAATLTLGIAQVSVWFCDNKNQFLECLDQYKQDSQTHSRGNKILKQGHEEYFKALKKTRVLSIDDVLSDPRVSSLQEDYLGPMGITSVLNAPIRVSGMVVGVVCHEHIGPPRKWTLEEENFAGSMADLLALAVEAKDRRIAQEELLKAKEAAEAASEAKSQFLANMSHEIRTPINGVMGMLQLMLDETLSEKQHRFVQTAYISAETLLTVIGDVLDFSKIEAGRFELDYTNFELRNAIDSSVRLFAEKAETKGLELSYMVNFDVPNMLIGDSNRLRQILINLVGNSLKFTESGEIYVHVGIDTISDHDVMLSIAVKDTGIGIPSDQCENIFESFSQGDQTMRRRHGGTGLGLAISRQLINMMGGDITLTSEVDSGSTFTFTVRMDIQKDAPAQQCKKLFSPQELSVLVVDDCTTVRKILIEYLKTWGCETSEAEDASQAMDKLQRGVDSAKPYHIVILDSHMPSISGLRLAKLVRSEPLFDATDLVLLSGFETPSNARLREHSIKGVVQKPVRASDLYNAIVTVANGSWDNPERSVHPLFEKIAAIEQKGRILLVEDNKINQEVAREMLLSLGHACTCVKSGEESLIALEQEDYDLVLMDCQMPGMDGYETTAAIRAWEEKFCDNGHIPIIALTAHAMKGDREHCISSGMDDYLSKPLQTDKLSFILGKWLKDKPSGLYDETDSARHEMRMRSDDEAELEVAVVKRCSGNRALAGRLLRDFVEQTAEDVRVISEAIDSNNSKQLANAAHRLKGAAGNLALGACEAAAAELEQRGRDNRIYQTEQLLTVIRTETERVSEMSIFGETLERKTS